MSLNAAFPATEPSQFACKKLRLTEPPADRALAFPLNRSQAIPWIAPTIDQVRPFVIDIQLLTLYN
jgi:hypothetical protein